MTQQIPDQIIYNDHQLGIDEIEGSGLFTPMDFGIECRSATTACWRGYVRRYVITNDQLILDSIWFKPKYLPPLDPPYKVPDIKDLPKVNGIEPVLISREINPAMGFFFTHAYKNLNKITHFNGSISMFDKTSSQLVLKKFYFEDGIIVNFKRESLGPAEPEPTFESTKKEMLEELERLKKLQKGEE
jgi:hypothetical protein